MCACIVYVCGNQSIHSIMRFLWNEHWVWLKKTVSFPMEMKMNRCRKWTFRLISCLPLPGSTNWQESGKDLPQGRFLNVSLQIYFGVQRSNLEEIKLSFCFEMCRENILLFKVIFPWTYYCIIFKSGRALSLTRVLFPSLLADWMLSIILIVLMYCLLYLWLPENKGFLFFLCPWSELHTKHGFANSSGFTLSWSIHAKPFI